MQGANPDGDYTVPVKPVPEARWREAQAHELDFWRHWRSIPVYRNVDLAGYWAGECRHFGLSSDFFHGKRVLDVGCGPVGLIHFVPEAALRIRIDPLLPDYREKLPLAEPGFSLAAGGEALPLPDSIADVAVCFNALDHMRDPDRALAELARVLQPGGTLLLMVHTFPAWVMPLLAVDRLHPHHWTARQFARQVACHLRVVREHSERRVFDVPAGQRWRPANWKYLAASAVLSTTYIVAARDAVV